MAIAFVQSKATTTQAGSLDVTFNSSTTSGNLIVAVAAMEFGSGSSLSCSDNKSNSYTTVENYLPHNEYYNFAMFYTYNITGGSTHTVTVTGTVAYILHLHIFEFSGILTTNPLDQQLRENSATDNYAFGPTGTLAQADEAVVAGLFAYAGPTGWTAGSGYSGLLETTNTATTASEYKIVSATTALTPDFGHAAGEAAGGIVATFKAAAGGGGVAHRLLTLGCG